MSLFSGAEIAQRLLEASSENPNVPSKGSGRLRWFTEQFKSYDISITVETVRRWLDGSATPEYENLFVLGEVLNKDVGWLLAGNAALSPKLSLGKDSSSWAIGIVAGIMQLQGVSAAFPGLPSCPEKSDPVHLYAITSGSAFPLHITLGVEEQNGWQFNVPVQVGNTLILGLVVGKLMEVQIIIIDRAGLLAQGARAGDIIKLTLDRNYKANAHTFKKLQNFHQLAQ
ncbi:hypothetical protein [Asticcacaulis taihuensis]|uniref:hypothetical protein n=1 Tax=Asticcacaulis taihuensis TaxID=260084 RepID=UPI0026E9C7A2|nr:hypothetical protein [Asticcacaulis taihuensis]